METMYKEMMRRLEDMENDLKLKQDHFQTMCVAEIDTAYFEQNAISSLMLMQQLKSAIHELKYQIRHLKEAMN